MCGADMSVEVGLFRKLLGASCISAFNILSILDGLAGMVHLHMSLEVPARGGNEVAEQAVLMFLADVVEEQYLCREANSLLFPIDNVSRAALAAPEFRLAVLTFPMSLQSCL